MVKKPGLGRGLDVLLGAGGSSAREREERDKAAMREISIELLQPGKYQPRIDMREESLEELAASIRAQGVIQPIVVRPVAEPGRYEIIAGERRWRAAQRAGLHTIPAVIRDVPDEAAVAMALIENIQREDLNPVEEASALHRLIEEFGMTHQVIADAVGRSRAAVTNLLRLLTLHPDVKIMLENGDLEMGHARALLGVEGDEQCQAAREVVARALTVRDTERLVRNWHKRKEEVPQRREDPDIRRLQDDLSERLGAKVAVKDSGKGKGRLEIFYNSLDELDGILAHMK